MKTEALFIFLILLLGLVLCSFLGNREGFSGNFTGTFSLNDASGGQPQSGSGTSTASTSMYDNYNHYSGSSTQLTPGTTYYGQNGTTAVVVTNSDGTQSLQITLPGSTTPVTFTPQQQTSTTSSSTTTDASSSTVESYTNYYGQNGSATTYYGPNGATATAIYADNGQQAIMVTTPTGTYYYNVSGTPSTTTTSSTQYYGSTGYPIQQAPSSTAYQGPYGGSAGEVTGPYGNTAYYAQTPSGYTTAGTVDNTPNTSSTQYYGANGGTAGSVTGPYGNTAYYAQGPAGNTVAGTSTSNTDYYNSLPPGIPRSQIPPGQEDLYILKSQVVPPVCPVCPSSSSSSSKKEQCPPCPACARCPEPAFDCKKVPNYSALDNDYLPAPVLSDFSTFGM